MAVIGSINLCANECPENYCINKFILLYIVKNDVTNICEFDVTTDCHSDCKSEMCALA